MPLIGVTKTKLLIAETFVCKWFPPNNRPSDSISEITSPSVSIQSDSRIKVTGARPGEKHYETMATSEEVSKAKFISVNKKLYLKISPSVKSPNKHAEEYNSHNAVSLTTEEMAEIIDKLIV